MMRGSGAVGHGFLPVAHQPTRDQGATVGPGLGSAKRCGTGGAFDQEGRRIGIILAPHPPGKAFIGQPRIIAQRLRHGVNQGAGAGLVGMKPHPRLRQGLPSRRDARQHAQDLGRAVPGPQEIVQPHLMRHVHCGTLKRQKRRLFLG